MWHDEPVHLTARSIQVEVLTAATAAAEYLRRHLPGTRPPTPKHSTYAVSGGWFIHDAAARRSTPPAR